MIEWIGLHVNGFGEDGRVYVHVVLQTLKAIVWSNGCLTKGSTTRTLCPDWLTLAQHYGVVSFGGKAVFLSLFQLVNFLTGIFKTTLHFNQN